MIHDADVKTVQIDSMALWRLYGGTKETVSKVGERATRTAMFEATQPKPEIHFYFRKSTDAYTDDGAFNPFGGTAESPVPVGVYHDAGPDIDGKLAGCRTLRMSGFGTPSDPASKPRPFAWKANDAELSIPGCAFGFDNNVVGQVIIQEFKGNSARYGFSYTPLGGNLIWCDGGKGTTTSEKPERFSVKAVNSREGYLAGNNANAEAKKNQGSVPYYIGKVLGDALQVFAMLPSLPTADGWINNPFYAVGVKLSSEMNLNTFPVDNLLLNTGDELEYARAVVWKQSAMYISPPNKEKIHKAVFTPGKSLDIDPTAEYARFVRRVKEVLARFKSRFDVALGSMKLALGTEGEVFNSAYSVISGQQFVNTDVEKKAARKFMQSCFDSTTRVKEYILKKVDDLVGNINLKKVDDLVGKIDLNDRKAVSDAEVSRIRALYTQLNDVLPHWSPSGPIADAEKKNRYMVGSIRQKYPVAETEEFTFVIRFKEVFEAIASPGRGLGVPDYLRFVPNWLAEPQAAGRRRRRRRTLRKYKKRGGALPYYGHSASERIYNAFTGMINSGLATFYTRVTDVCDPDVVVARRSDMLRNEFLDESNADASLAYRDAEFAKFASSGPPSDDFITGIQKSGYTTFTDFVEFACGFEPNTLPPRNMKTDQIEYAISLIMGCQSSRTLRDQALLAELTDYILQLAVPTLQETAPPLQEAAPPLQEAAPPLQEAAPPLPRAAPPHVVLTLQKPAPPSNKRNFATLATLADNDPPPAPQSKKPKVATLATLADNDPPPVQGQNYVMNSNFQAVRGRGAGRRTFRRRLPKLL